MKSASTRGMIKENEIAKMYEDAGYTVHRVRRVKFQPRDIFGADVIALNERGWVLAAVTDKSNVSRSRKRLKSYPHAPGTKRIVWFYDKEGEWHFEDNL